MSATLSELASRFDCRVEGDGATRVSRVATLSSAGKDAISFLANPLYRAELAATRAAAVSSRLTDLSGSWRAGMYRCESFTAASMASSSTCTR